MTRRPSGVFVVVAALAAFCASLTASRTARAGDPWVNWYTVRTPHFRVHYHGGLEALAQRTANLAEATRARIAVALESLPSDTTDILLTDVTDSANGSASGVPYNAIRLFVTAPEDQSPLGDYDDWMTELVTHEQTHVVHIDTMSGLPAIVNVLLGKTYAPNQVQPHWVLEGLAVALESRLTSGGRLRSPIFDMYLRADVLEDNVAGLDEMSHDVRRWPGGDVWYLYGGKFFGWIHDVYGPDVFAAVASDYGQNLIPWGLNRSIYRATGKTYPELYRGFITAMTRKYEAQAAAVRARGLREGTQLTHAGYYASNPRVVPACARRGTREEILYARDDAHTLPGLYRLPLATPTKALESDVELVVRTDGGGRVGSFDPACGIVFDSGAPSARHHFWDELHYQAPGTASPSGDRGARTQWTTSLRARTPDVSPDGRHVTFSTNHAGTLTLRIADVLPEGGIANVRRLVPSAAGEEAFSPRFSPDGRRVAYSVWTEGGYRDIRVVDVATGAFENLTHDRGANTQPTWSRDGKFVYFSSARTGIANIYAKELATGALHQVTNVINGAFMPEISADGRTLYYVGYTSKGYDLFAIPLDPAKWLDAEPPPDDRPEPHLEPSPVTWPVTAYDPWDTLRPHSYALDYGPGSFGQALTVRVNGSDIAAIHSFSGLLTTQAGIVTGALTYTYSRLPANVSLTVHRSVARRAPIVVNGVRYETRDESFGVTSAISYTMPREFESQSVNLAYSASIVRPHYPIGVEADPYFESTFRPNDTFQSAVRFGWRYSGSFRPLYAISPERGVALNVSAQYAGPPTLSDGTLATFDARFAGYLKAPWFRHHVFALGLAGGSAGGDLARRGFYSTGGYADTPDLFTAVTDALFQGSYVLRGYPPGAFIGKQYNLLNLEYRFPFALGGPDVGWVDRGVSTLPVFLHGFWGVLFADYGGSYDVIDPHDPLAPFHLGVGAEVNASFTLGYFLDTGLRVGWAKGLSQGAVAGSQTYVVVAASF